MSLSGLFSRLRWGLTPNRSKRGKSGRQRRRCRPLVEQLETRVVPAAVNENFELDGNAQTNVLHSAPIPTGSSEVFSHDWDQVYQDSLNGNTALSGAGVIAFITDTTGLDSTSFTQGSKDINDISTWGWATPEHSEDKNDLLHAMVAAYIQNGDLFIYFGADRFAQNGDAKVGFWFFQDSVSLNPDGTFNGSHLVGDILVESTFTQGGGVSNIQVFMWVGSGGNFGSLQLILPLVSPDKFAIVNDSANDSPWPYQPKNNPADIFPTGGFYEGGVNLTSLLVAAEVLEPGTCLNFSSFLANTRSSQSEDASLDDFVLGIANISNCGSVSWEKRSGTGVLLGGATFQVSPDPTDNVGALEVVDNTGQLGYTGADVDPTPGVFKVLDVHPNTYTITETAPPPNYFLDPGHIISTAVVPDSGNLNVSVGTMGQDDTADFHNFQPAIDIVKFVNGQDANSPTGPHVAVGSTLTFTYVVTNTGDAELANVAVTDDKLGAITSFTGDTNGNNQLDLTETWTYTITATAVVGQQTNVGTATGQAVGQTVTDSDSANYFGDAPSITLVKLTNGTDNDSPTGPHVAVGSTITWTYNVTNTGNVALSNVVVTDDNGTPGNTADDFTVGTISSLAAGASASLTHTGTATAGQYGNVGTVTGTDANGTGQTVTASNPDHYFGDAPSIDLLKTGTLNLGGNGIANPGDLINYAFTVTNTGNVTLTSVTLADLVGGVTVGTLTDNAGNGVTVLAPGDVETATGTYAITQADINAGSKFNDAQVTGTPPTGPNVTDTDDHTETIPQSPGIILDKTGSLNLGGNGIANPGDLINYTFTVLNTGNVTLTGVTLTDLVGGVTVGTLTDTAGNGVSVLAPGDIETATGGYAITQADIDAGHKFNNAQVTGTPPTGSNVTDTDDHDQPIAQTPSINLIKTGTLNLGGNGIANPGDIINYTFTVTNIGNVTLNNATLSDLVGDVTVGSLSDNAGNGVSVLAPGDVETATGTYAITQADIDAGFKYNNAQVTGTPPTGPNVTDTDDHNQPIGQTPSIHLSKIGTINLGGNGIANPGDIINYTFTVTNIGTVTLNNVTLVDLVGGVTVGTLTDIAGNGVSVLAPGDVETATGSYAITQADIDAGHKFNDAQVTGTPPTGPNVTDTDDHDQPIPQGPSISLDKTGTIDLGGNGIANPGDIINYTFTVTNTGNVTLNNVALSDLVGGVTVGTLSDNAGNGVSVLAPGDVETATGTYAITQTDIDAGHKFNDAQVTGTPPTGSNVTDTDDHDQPIAQTPSISLEKTGTIDLGGNGIANPGDIINYMFTVTNTGNVTLTNVNLSDLVGGVTVGSLTDTAGNGVDVLAPGDVETATGTYAITQTDIDAGIKFNNAQVTGTPPTGPSVTDTDDHNQPIAQTPSISLVKTGTLDLGANGQPDPGDIINYTFTVTNTGNVTLTNVTLTDLVGGVTVGAVNDNAGNGPDVLAPGEVETATGTYAITQADIDAGFKFNVAKVTGLAFDVTKSPQQVEATDDHIQSIPAPAPPRVGSLSGTVYLDLNNNGKQEKKEKGIKNVTVTLQVQVNGVWTTVATTKTNLKGKYTFSNLTPATYRIIEKQPKGFRDGKDTLGRVNGILSGLKNANDQFTVSLLSGAVGVDYNFGERASKTVFI